MTEKEGDYAYMKTISNFINSKLTFFDKPATTLQDTLPEKLARLAESQNIRLNRYRFNFTPASSGSERDFADSHAQDSTSGREMRKLKKK